MELWAPIAAVLVLALLVESMIEYFTDGLPLPAWSKKVGAAAVGVALALIYQIDIFGFLLNVTPLWPPIGPVLTGLMLGRGANYVHDFAGLALGGGQGIGFRGQGRGDRGAGPRDAFPAPGALSPVPRDTAGGV